MPEPHLPLPAITAWRGRASRSRLGVDAIDLELMSSRPSQSASDWVAKPIASTWRSASRPSSSLCRRKRRSGVDQVRRLEALGEGLQDVAQVVGSLLVLILRGRPAQAGSGAQF